MKLGLGTVQFGIDYGISNQGGRTPPDEVARILAQAELLGVTTLDTAPAYGASEEVLGQCLGNTHAFSIVTKTPKFSGEMITPEDADKLLAVFSESLARLGVPKIHALMAHDADDLLKPGGELLVAAMEKLRAKGLVSRVGASIYSGSQIDALRVRHRLDIFQVPVNILDQRMISGGWLRTLKQDGCEIHARSAFLQGALLMDPEALPPHFQSVRGHLRKLREYLQQHRISALEASLGFLAGLPEVNVTVCGVNDRTQLAELASACHPINLDLSGFSYADESILNPSLWKR